MNYQTQQILGAMVALTVIALMCRFVVLPQIDTGTDEVRRLREMLRAARMGVIL